MKRFSTSIYWINTASRYIVTNIPIKKYVCCVLPTFIVIELYLIIIIY